MSLSIHLLACLAILSCFYFCPFTRLFYIFSLLYLSVHLLVCNFSFRQFISIFGNTLLFFFLSITSLFLYSLYFHFLFLFLIIYKFVLPFSLVCLSLHLQVFWNHIFFFFTHYLQVCFEIISSFSFTNYLQVCFEIISSFSFTHHSQVCFEIISSFSFTHYFQVCFAILSFISFHLPIICYYSGSHLM